jgi:toxin-antitoxin system PIN domain toxin
MRAVDTSILVYAELRTHPRSGRARELLSQLAEGNAPWAIPWPCVYECLRIVTHSRVFHPPMNLAAARADLASILASPSLVLLSETDRHAAILQGLFKESPVSGNLVHDLHVAALCREHGVSELFTADIDLVRFVGLKVTNPFE